MFKISKQLTAVIEERMRKSQAQIDLLPQPPDPVETTGTELVGVMTAPVELISKKFFRDYIDSAIDLDRHVMLQCSVKHGNGPLRFVVNIPRAGSVLLYRDLPSVAFKAAPINNHIIAAIPLRKTDYTNIYIVFEISHLIACDPVNFYFSPYTE
jgi:hypothetical protein